MLDMLWLVPLLPLAGSAILMVTRGELSARTVAVIGAGSVGLSAVAALLVASGFLASDGDTVRSGIATWIASDRLVLRFGLHLDALSLVMILVITLVGFLIHLYSTAYMAGDEGFSRFFAYMNLFTAAMLVLVLADNLLLLYLGWEGVGLCSYLLIGFWYKDPANGYAARKAFVVTRAGDTAMLIGLLLLATSLGTLEIAELLERAESSWAVGSGIATAAAALLLAGAVGKSAQLPLQTWLPDAMAGPTPVSALIHAATMVTAGVYLIARTHTLFSLAPDVQLAVAVIGALTLLGAAFAALAQRDIKRILAYSTMSQIGYMFLALGVGAWSAAIFHFMTHAFFKALLFLAAGALILALHHEQDIFRMGGLRRRLPAVFWTFLIGAAALASVPLVTSGFYSKEQILAGAWAFDRGGALLGLAGLVAAFVTSVYIFRAVFIVFFGPQAGHGDAADVALVDGRGESTRGGRIALLLPLVALAMLSIVGGFVDAPASAFSDFMSTALPRAETAENETAAVMLEITAAIVSLAGIVVAYRLFFPHGGRVKAPAVRERAPWPAALDRLWASGWGFDRAYDALFVKPFVAIAAALRGDPVDDAYSGVAAGLRAAWRGAAESQTGELRWYAAGMLAGLVIVLAVALLL
ncbi:MAG: NADH-quinone oxidoreductase subunit L [Gammaproteobacteria bacterium]|nr:NADH-quinone oxidoreductase subunit L [Gammaproteobacteria bacterium]